MACRGDQAKKETMTVRELISKLESVENKDLPVFVEYAKFNNKKAKGVFLVSDAVRDNEIPRECVIVQ